MDNRRAPILSMTTGNENFMLCEIEMELRNKAASVACTSKLTQSTGSRNGALSLLFHRAFRIFDILLMGSA